VTKPVDTLASKLAQLISPQLSADQEAYDAQWEADMEAEYQRIHQLVYGHPTMSPTEQGIAEHPILARCRLLIQSIENQIPDESMSWKVELFCDRIRSIFTAPPPNAMGPRRNHTEGLDAVVFPYRP
jgi:hypothetical protein